MKRILFAVRVCFLVCVCAVTTFTSSNATISTNSAKKSSKKVKASGAKKRSADPELFAVNEDGVPRKLAEHLEKLQQMMPGNDGLAPAGSYAEWAFQARAYPATDVSLGKIESARFAHLFHSAKGFSEDQQNSWQSVGPSRALYPLFQFRTRYVPAAYYAGGRTTAMALDPDCDREHCRLWVTPAGGGVWRTDNAFGEEQNWKYLSGSFQINSSGSITLDPNNHNTVWVGTGEANACGSGCEAGVGLYKSTDGGDTWSGPIGKDAFNARAIGSIAISPIDSNTIYAATTRAIRGVSSVCCSGAVTLAPGAPPWGLYKSTDGGTTWTFMFNGAATTTGCTDPVAVANNLTPCSPRGVRRVALDPSDPNTVYATSYARGVWRSSDGGATWTQIFAALADPVATSFTERPEIAVTKLASGKTRVYLGIGQLGGGTAASPNSQLFRSDDVASGIPTFISLTSNDPANVGYGSFDYCGGQCWYDNFVYTPKGHPDIVYVGGSYQYNEARHISNGRGVALSTDAGVTFTDMTMDATDPIHPNGIHPDQHSIVTNPRNPFEFIESSDGGMMRSSGSFADVSANCAPRTPPLTGAALARCQQLLSRVPTRLRSLNRGLSTLQFQSLSVSPFNSQLLQGGTQDNGTWQSTEDRALWLHRVAGDGGQSGFDVANPHFRFHNYTGASPDVNFSDGALIDWNWIGDPISQAGAQFYVPMISDPRVSGSMFTGTRAVYRTKTFGLGTMTLADLRTHCNEFTGDFSVTCGDWVPLGSTTLTATSLGSRSGGSVAQVRRTPADTSTLWAATSAGRVFISQNADADPASSVSFVRIDTASTPGRFVSGIYVDPNNANHAFVSYSGYNASTPATPGHVFEVTYDPTTMSATFTDRSYDLLDLPITDVAVDNVTGDLYASSDFGVLVLRAGSASWKLAAPGMPNVEVAGLTILPRARRLYAASHGLSAWLLVLPGGSD
jgi:hypothetical protein